MKIAVCVKQVPDSWAEKKLRDSDALLDRESVESVMNELDEYAVEEALKIVEANGSGEIVIVTMGPQRADEAIRKSLSMGADSGIHLVDAGLAGSDAIATSYALAKVIEGRAFDLIIFGSESTDARMSVVPAMVAERLGLAQLTFANKVEVAGGSVTIDRVGDNGIETVTASLPAVVSVVEKINEPRYPSFKGIMGAKKKPIESLSLADAGLDAGQTGLAAAWSKVDSFAARPAKAAGVVVQDEGEGGVAIADFLDAQKIL